jgi:hypothetical protein
MQLFTAQGEHLLTVRDGKGNSREARLAVRFQRLVLLPPAGKQKRYDPIEVTVIHARENVPEGNTVAEASDGVEALDWKLVTDLPVRHVGDAVEKLNWYAMRWKIETSHKILKSGCRAEESKLRTAPRLTNLLAIFCILSWRVFWLTMTARSGTSIEATAALTQEEMKLLDHLVPDKRRTTPEAQSLLSEYLVKVARLGGYLARASDGPPGNIVLWRGLLRLHDIHLGFLAAKIVGN